MAELIFFTGTMDSGKSTLALQTEYNFTARGRHGLLFTNHDRSGPARITSRIGLQSPAIEASADTDFAQLVAADEAATGQKVDFIVCDEAQFYSPEQVDQLAQLVDEQGIDVFAFGIMTDFRTKLFPGSARFLELADRTEILQVRALCWCGRRATHNARTVNGKMVSDGDQIVLGDTRGEAEVGYQVLCRQHHMQHNIGG